MEVLDHKCPTCRAKLPFNPKTQKWDCEYCGNSYTLEQLTNFEEHEKEKESELHVNPELDLYECPDCGANIIADKNTTPTFCVYCGNPSILKNRLIGEFKPAKIIPFIFIPPLNILLMHQHSLMDKYQHYVIFL